MTVNDISEMKYPEAHLEVPVISEITDFEIQNVIDNQLSVDSIFRMMLNDIEEEREECFTNLIILITTNFGRTERESNLIGKLVQVLVNDNEFTITDLSKQLQAICLLDKDHSITRLIREWLHERAVTIIEESRSEEL